MNAPQAQQTIKIPRLLFETLEQQRHLSLELLEILEMEKKVLVKVDLTALINLIGKKQQRLDLMISLDEQLQKLVNQVLARQEENTPAPGGKKTLTGRIEISKLIQLADQKEAELLGRYRTALTEAREEILVRNLYNQRFAVDTLGYLNDAISLITAGISEEIRYNPKGKTRYAVNAPNLISRAV